MLVVMAGRSSSKTLASRLSSTNMAFRVRTRVPSVMTLVLRWSDVAFTKRFGYLAVSGGSLIKSIISLCF